MPLQGPPIPPQPLNPLDQPSQRPPGSARSPVAAEARGVPRVPPPGDCPCHCGASPQPGPPACPSWGPRGGPELQLLIRHHLFITLRRAGRGGSGTNGLRGGGRCSAPRPRATGVGASQGCGTPLARGSLASAELWEGSPGVHGAMGGASHHPWNHRGVCWDLWNHDGSLLGSMEPQGALSQEGGSPRGSPRVHRATGMSPGVHRAMGGSPGVHGTMAGISQGLQGAMVGGVSWGPWNHRGCLLGSTEPC